MHALAFGLYIVFIISWFLHLPARLPMLGLVRFDLVIAVTILALTLLGGVTAATTAREQRVRKWLTILVLYVVVTIPFVEWPGSVVRFGLEKLAKAIAFYFFTAQLTTTTRRLKILMFVFIGCQTFRVLEPLYLHQTEGYWGSAASMANWESMDRLSGAPHDVINPNGLAFVILTVLPFSHFLMTGVIGRLLYLTVLPAHLYALVLTASRSGFVGLVAVYALVWWRSRHKILMTVAAVLVFGVALPRLGDDSVDRYLSIFSSDTKNAATAEGRIRGAIQTFQVAVRRPLFGHGLGTSRETNANFVGFDQPAHNLFSETAQEIGFVGLAILAALILSIARNTADALRAFQASAQGPTFPVRVATALQVFVGMNVLFSLASYGLTGYAWYFVAGLSEVLVRVAHAAPHPVLIPADKALTPFRPPRPSTQPNPART